MGAGDFACTKAFKVIGVDLAVDEGTPLRLQGGNQLRKGALAGVRFCCEHGFAEKAGPYRHAIESADEPVVKPRLDRVGMSRVMKGDVCLLDLGGDPGAGLVRTLDASTLSNDICKTGVYRVGEGFLFQNALQTFRNLQFSRVEDEARVRRPPDEWQSRDRPGENTVPIGLQQALDA